MGEAYLRRKNAYLASPAQIGKIDDAINLTIPPLGIEAFEYTLFAEALQQNLTVTETIAINAFEYLFIDEVLLEPITIADTITINAFEYLFIDETFLEPITVIDTLSVDAFEYLFVDVSLAEDITVIDTISASAFEYTIVDVLLTDENITFDISISASQIIFVDETLLEPITITDTILQDAFEYIFIDKSVQQDLVITDFIDQIAAEYQLASDSVIDNDISFTVTIDEDIVFPTVPPPILTNVFNIGPETATITVQNQSNEFAIRVYFSLSNLNGQPNTSNDYVTLLPQGFSGDTQNILIHNYFNLEGNEDYTFYARAYDTGLNEQSGVVSKAFSTPKYSFTHNPEWISSNLDTTETSITFSYKNNNAVDATLYVLVRDPGGNQAMDILSESIQAGQTLIFNSNDYDDSFTAGTTYDFDAKFIKTDYNDSGTTSNQVTTDEVVVVTTETPTITRTALGSTTASFKIKNEDASTATILWEVDETPPNANSVSLGANGETTVDLTGLTTNQSYTIYATAQAAGENKSAVASNSFTPRFTTATPGTGVRSDLTTESSVTFSLTNNDTSTADVTWRIRRGSTSGTTEASGTESIPGQNGTTVSASNLNDNTTYYLTNVVATATNKFPSAAGTVRSETTDEATVFYTVTFKDWNGSILKTETVESGNDATAPADPTRTGYVFTGWDTVFTNVTSDLTVTAEYQIRTEEPTISILGTTDDDVTFSIKNEDASQATVNYSINTSPAKTGSFVVSANGTTGPITRSGFDAETTYTITATAQASGEAISENATKDFTTDAPPAATYTLRARSAGVSQVGTTIGGTSYTLTTSYQDVDTTTSSKTTSLSAPINIVLSGITYNFASWHNITTNTTISTNRNTSITWSSDTDIEVRYVPGGFGF